MPQIESPKLGKKGLIIIVVFTIIIIALVIVFIAGLGDVGKSGVLIDVKTNEESEYSMEILRQSEIENDKVLSWLNDCFKNQEDNEDNEKYYTLKNMGSKGIDLYLYMPNAKEIIGDITMSNIKVTEAGTALKLIVETNDKTKHTRESGDLILHIYVTNKDDATPIKSEMLIVNDKTYFCAAATSKTW